MVDLTSIPERGQIVVEGDGTASPNLQNFFDDLSNELNTNLLGQAVQLPSYTVAQANALTISPAGAQIFVSNEAGGAVVAFSDGTNWRRCTDRAVIS